MTGLPSDLDVCRAAGCVVTDLSGQPLNGGRGLVVGADADTHERLIEIARAHLEPVA